VITSRAGGRSKKQEARFPEENGLLIQNP